MDVKEMSDRRLAVLIAAALAVLIGLGWAWYGLFGSGDSGDETGTRTSAQQSCQEFVKSRLKSPSSAKFSNESAVTSGGLWTVTGSVDSQNSFGASIRNTYRCTTSTTDGDNWTLGDIALSAN